MLEITREIAQKVRDTVDAGLTNGVGVQEAGKMCVEAAVCFALGLPHGDDPGCVSAPLRRLKIRLNDSRWSSDMVRAAGLRRLAIAQLGSKGVLDDAEFVRRVVEMTIRRSVPTALRSAAKVNPKHADKLEVAAVRCEQEGTREAACNANEVARAAAYAYAYADADADAAAAAYADADADAAAAAAAYADADADAAAAAAYAAAAYAYAAAAAAYAYAYAYAAAADADAAAAAAYAYAYAYAAAAAAAYAAAAAADAAYAYAAAAAAYADAARDKSLAQYAEWVVEILVAMDAPGCEWLDLVPLAS